MITLWQFLDVCTGQHLCLQDINGVALAQFTDEMYERIKDIPVDRIIAHEDKIIDVRLGVTKQTLIDMGYSSSSDYYSKYGKEYYYQHRNKILQKKHDKLVQKYKEEQNENTKK